MSRNQSSAKRAGRAVLELAALLGDGAWHRTTYLGIAAGKYLRPEIAWRFGRGNITGGQRLYINQKLDVWERAGRVEKRRNGKFVEWRLAKSDWALPYLRALIEILKGTLENHSKPSVAVRKSERKREILRLRKEGFSQRQIAQKVQCCQATVFLVLKASRESD